MIKKIGFKEVPFDLACPSLKELIGCRVCKGCDVYFSTTKSLKEHQRWCLKKDVCVETKRIRPKRVAAVRQNEKLIVWTSRLNDEHADWVDNDYVDNTGVHEEEYNQGTTDNQILSELLQV